MKKFLMSLIALFSTVTLAACQNDNTEETTTVAEETTAMEETTTAAENQEEQQATIVLKEVDDELATEEVSFAEGDNLYDVMDENFDIEDPDDNGFITSIDGHEQDEEANVYWTFTVNGEMVMVGAKEVVLEAGDEVVFTLAEM